jgi:radical SAM-linked protein
MAHSQGFNPHPKISWIGAAPTGVASEAEYLEIQVIRELDPATLTAELDRALPDGLDVLETVPAGPGVLPDRIDASRWMIELPGVSVDRLGDAVGALLAAESVVVVKTTKNGPREIDVRPAIVDLEVLDQLPETINCSGDLSGKATDYGSFTRSGVGNVTETASSGAELPIPVTVTTARLDGWRDQVGPYGILVAVVRQTTPAVRPDDVLSALRAVADLDPQVAAKATRIAQGRLDGAGSLVDPFVADRVAR